MLSKSGIKNKFNVCDIAKISKTPTLKTTGILSWQQCVLSFIWHTENDGLRYGKIWYPEKPSWSPFFGTGNVDNGVWEGGGTDRM